MNLQTWAEWMAQIDALTGGGLIAGGSLSTAGFAGKEDAK